MFSLIGVFCVIYGILDYHIIYCVHLCTYIRFIKYFNLPRGGSVASPQVMTERTTYPVMPHLPDIMNGHIPIVVNAKPIRTDKDTGTCILVVFINRQKYNRNTCCSNIDRCRLYPIILCVSI